MACQKRIDRLPKLINTEKSLELAIQLSKEVPSDMRSFYYMSKKCSDFIGVEAKHWIDFFVKQKCDAVIKTHD